MLVALHSATESLRRRLHDSGRDGFPRRRLRRRGVGKAIETGLGPWSAPDHRAGPVIEITSPASAIAPLEFKPFEPSLIANGAEGMREAVRELAHYGVDHVKIMSTGRFYFKPTGEMVNEALPNLEELKAAVDEAHRRGMWVATHTYGGDGL